MSGGPRRCPVCERTMPDAVCPEDRMATLLVDLPVHDAPLPRAGEVLGARYEVLEPIGSGGYGRVFRARHLGTGQDLALKVLRVPPDEDGAFAVQRFFLEARATSGLTHPNTVRVFDFGQDDLGRVFLAMELLAGRTLREELRVRKGRGERFSDAEVVQFGVAITKSLGEAHEQGLVHRDLKPDNVFLHRVAGDDPVVKVLDFGIAKLGGASRHTLSSDTSVPGTPAYMAPEHAFNLAVDGRTDLYALGVLLYQLSTLELPYQAPSDPQTLYMHAYQAVPDPRAVAPVADGLAEVVMRAMQKKPEARFADARAMRTALAAALAAGDGLGSDRASTPPSPRADRAPTAPLPAADARTSGSVEALPREAAFDDPRPRAAAKWLVPGVLAAIVTLAVAAWALLRRPAEAPAREVAAPAARVAPPPTAPEPAIEAPPEPEPAAEVAPEPAVEVRPAPKKRKRRARKAPRPARRPAAPPPEKEETGKDVLHMRVEELLEQ